MIEDYEKMMKHILKQTMKAELDTVFKLELFLNESDCIEVMKLVNQQKRDKALKCPQDEKD